MSKSTTTKQTNEPPAWSKPLLTKSASEGMRLYDEGKGYGVYGGPTVAERSAPTLAGINSLLAATGYAGAPVTNESILNTPQIQQARSAVAQVAAKNAQQPAQQAAGPGVWIQQEGPRVRRAGGSYDQTYEYVNTITGERSKIDPTKQGGNAQGTQSRLW